MARKLKSDAVLFGTTLLLLAFGLACVYSASVAQFQADVVTRQGIWVAMGMAGLFAAMHVDYQRFRNRTVLLWIAGAILVALVGVLFGSKVGGGRRWIGIGSLGIQPSELAKLIAVMFVAAVLERRLEEHERLEPGLFQAGLLILAFLALIFWEPDYGGGIVLLVAAFAIMFASGLSYRWVATAALVLSPPILAMLLYSDHSRRRLDIWLDPFADPLFKGFQTVQSLIAVGTGGVFGKGYNHGVQKLFYLPEPHNDYIFAVIAEEQGLIGATVVLLCFVIIVWRGLVVARRAPDAFGSLLAVGITAMLGVPALVNMSVVTNLLPAKGIALPFVSAGGSSMIVSLVAMGVLLNISQQASATE